MEGEALLYMASDVPPDFSRAVDLILGVAGRVMLAGIGKSGHVARKIAATLASTGTPAHFVHPAEASHGDLGMIRPKDLCILISNSGETTELGDLIAHCKRFSIPIIGISRKPESTLMKAATLRLTLPDLPEACAIGMAPTTSTILTMGLGDALAVALMEKRRFMPEHFRTYHPGGKLGARLSTVSQLMHERAIVPVVGEETPMADAIVEMSARGFGVVGVADDEGRLVGVISDGDLRRNINHLMSLTAGQVCTRSPITAPPDLFAAEALSLMNTCEIGALFVVDDEGRPLGILHLQDCLRAGVS
ncbi:SIS domain-containing protein [Rhodovulum sp. P5]|uniref:KpsF/GutQ family sugar-phosphate isomerase n=1 Tax=Rhodovulum sp. P5 TaxID=1564506 RepID=UPI0020A2C004|nr:KpsF/GutQ family sugar-phosphate isomerase [Rhodovulum sp. P5]